MDWSGGGDKDLLKTPYRGGGGDNLTHDGDFEEQRSHNYKGNVKSLMEIKQEHDYSKTRF